MLGPNGESGGSVEGKVRGRGGSVGGNGGSRGSRAGKGGVGADGEEVKGGGIEFGVSKSLLGEIPRVAIGEGGGEPFRDDRGAVW
ncbi:hypothetical protein Tco_0832174 [Tanacetum coccineum]